MPANELVRFKIGLDGNDYFFKQGNGFTFGFIYRFGSKGYQTYGKN